MFDGYKCKGQQLKVKVIRLSSVYVGNPCAGTIDSISVAYHHNLILCVSREPSNRWSSTPGSSKLVDVFLCSCYLGSRGGGLRCTQEWINECSAKSQQMKIKVIIKFYLLLLNYSFPYLENQNGCLHIVATWQLERSRSIKSTVAHDQFQ